MSELREKIEKLVEDESISSYEFQKKTGVTGTALRRLRNGESEIGNLTLSKAEIMAEFYNDVTFLRDAKTD